MKNWGGAKIVIILAAPNLYYEPLLHYENIIWIRPVGLGVDESYFL